MIIYHKHHIVPRHMGGTDDPSNLINLTIEEHAEAHRMLYEEHGKWEDKIAWQMLSGQISNAEAANEVRRLANLGNKHFEGKTHSPEYKKELSKMMREKRKKHKTMGHHKPHTDETKEICRQAALKQEKRNTGGYKLDDTFKEKKRKYMSDPNNNPSKRPEVREKLRQAALLREQKKREQKSPL